jgi:8-oxo-dGTP pyrophosphatase MutT (NUDIX family)
VTEPRVQYAALPYRQSGDKIEILLVTSLGTKRWIIPKGWPISGHEAHEAAAHEALEEAGVVGTIGSQAIGTYRYEKRLKSGATVPCTVEVFPLNVGSQRRHWPEKGRREAKWLPPEEAAKTVSDTELGEIILAWSRRLLAPETVLTGEQTFPSP